MRYVTCLFVLAAMPLTAAAQHSPSLPSIGLPLPAIGLSHTSPPWERRQLPSWERPHLPEWERNRIPPWEKGYVPPKRADDDDHRRRGRDAQFVYYYVPYPVAVPQQPQVIVVQQPPITITVEVPERREVRAEAAPVERAPEPPYVPSGDRTLYVIPGCYVGNVPPTDVKLPVTCDLKKLTTFNP
jgi:hypothetical protein